MYILHWFFSFLIFFSCVKTSGCFRPNTELLPDGQAALPDRRVRAAVRGGAGVLGAGQQPGGALLLDDIHTGTQLKMRTLMS